VTGPIALGVFGDGSDGGVTFDGSNAVAGTTRSGSTYTLTRDVYYIDATVNSGSIIVMAGFRMFCTGTLWVKSGGLVHGDGNASVTSTGGGTLSGGTLGAAGNGGNGAAGGAGGVAGGVSNALGGNGGDGGAATGGGVGGGGAGATATAPTAASGLPRHLVSLITATIQAAVTIYTGAAGGRAGNASAGTGLGGGGGGGARVIGLYANVLICDGTIRCLGGDGGPAVVGSSVNVGGGGGGGGGAIMVAYRTKSGTNSTFTAATVCAGGAGGAPAGTGATGAAGSVGQVYEVPC